jgi:hypothetical protein
VLFAVKGGFISAKFIEKIYKIYKSYIKFILFGGISEYLIS